MDKTQYENHPLADLFPMLSDNELSELAKDIKENGLKFPIEIFDGKILDGRNRYRACQIAKVEPVFRAFTGDDPAKHIISMNINRRHLDESQRAIIGAKIANIQHGEVGKGHDRSDPQIGGSANPLKNIKKVSQTEAAGLLNVSERNISRAKKVLKEAPEKEKEIMGGHLTLNKALKEIKDKEKPKEEKIHPDVTVNEPLGRALKHAYNCINELRMVSGKHKKEHKEAFKTVDNFIHDTYKTF